MLCCAALCHCRRGHARSSWITPRTHALAFAGGAYSHLFRSILLVHSHQLTPFTLVGAADERYGFPDHIGGLIIEGSVVYPNGPSSWSATNPSGSFGFTMLPAGTGDDKKDAQCPPVPDSLKVDKSKVTAMSFKEHGA
jgi:hypothetical protein